MTRKLKTKRVDRSLAGAYLSKARGFRADAEAMAALAGEFSGNALAVPCVQAAIAYADALAVRAGEVKSASGEHLDAVDLLESVVRVASDADRAAVKALRYVLQRKDEGIVTLCVRQALSGRSAPRLTELMPRWREEYLARRVSEPRNGRSAANVTMPAGAPVAVAFRPESLARYSDDGATINWGRLATDKHRLPLALAAHADAATRTLILSAQDGKVYTYAVNPPYLAKYVEKTRERGDALERGAVVPRVSDRQCASCRLRLSCPHWLGLLAAPEASGLIA